MTPRPNISSSDWTAIARYVSGEATAEERAELDARATRDAVFAQLLSESFTGWALAGKAPRHRDGEAAWRRVRGKVGGRVVDRIGTPTIESRGVPGGGFKGRTLRHTIWYALAGVSAVILAVVLNWPSLAVGHRRQRNVPVSAYVTGNGERAHVTLPDGNIAILNVASRLEVPADYLLGNHRLRLSGEALFIVQHDKQTPFTVTAGQTTTRVLGTSFLVRRYATDSATTVAVREGRVAVGGDVITANELVEVRQQRATVRRTTSASSFSFATGTLTLDEMPLSQAIPELDRWYDADIRLGSSAIASHGVIDGKFAAGSLADLAKNLEFVLDVRAVRSGRVLTLYERGR